MFRHFLNRYNFCGAEFVAKWENGFHFGRHLGFWRTHKGDSQGLYEFGLWHTCLTLWDELRQTRVWFYMYFFTNPDKFSLLSATFTFWAIYELMLSSHNTILCVETALRALKLTILHKNTLDYEQTRTSRSWSPHEKISSILQQSFISSVSHQVLINNTDSWQSEYYNSYIIMQPLKPLRLSTLCVLQVHNMSSTNGLKHCYESRHGFYM